MDPRLLKYYNRELQHIREMGGEFAKEYPKIAGRLTLDSFECADPYVERLLEGFAFLAARVQLKNDTEFPRFTQHLLEMVYPHYLVPTPSMAVVQFQPDMKEGALADGFLIPRGSVLRAPLAKGEQTPCEYRTAHDVKLWPVEISQVEYFTHARDFGNIEPAILQKTRGGLRLKLRATAGLTFDQVGLDVLSFHLRGGEVAMRVYEQLFANSVAVVVRPAGAQSPWQELIDRSCIRRVGFGDDEALLPYGTRSLQGYRLLHEYFAFPDRFLFAEIGGLSRAIRRCKSAELELVILLDKGEITLQNVLDPGNFVLHCSPAINLFPKRCDSVHLSERQNEYHVVPDRTAPMEFEVYDVTGVTGTGTSSAEQEFLPFYSRTNQMSHSGKLAYYSVRRAPRVLSQRQKEQGPRSSYVGSETFISLVDAEEAPYRHDLKQLALTALCTNRDLPLLMTVGQGRTDFTLQSSAPVAAIRCVAGPTRPRASRAEGEFAWRLISHLSLNYLSLLDSADGAGAVALRDMLLLHGGDAEAALQLQVEGVKSISSAPITRRVLTKGPIAFARGIEITVTLDESAFGGSGVFLLGAVLEQFFARYVSLNSFTETVVRTVTRGEIIRWPARTGKRHTI